MAGLAPASHVAGALKSCGSKDESSVPASLCGRRGYHIGRCAGAGVDGRGKPGHDGQIGFSDVWLHVIMYLISVIAYMIIPTYNYVSDDAPTGHLAVRSAPAPVAATSADHNSLILLSYFGNFEQNKNKSLRFDAGRGIVGYGREARPERSRSRPQSCPLAGCHGSASSRRRPFACALPSNIA